MTLRNSHISRNYETIDFERDVSRWPISKSVWYNKDSVAFRRRTIALKITNVNKFFIKDTSMLKTDYTKVEISRMQAWLTIVKITSVRADVKKFLLGLSG
uniref:Uncharacterized protein n=1 Tax=Romanomermis culicivorax TaxID=13658 RepID=A0A915JEL8_ROMCU